MSKKKNKGLLCYMCDSPATSREHVPPLCLFPESKDIKEHNFRNNLFTVPSCDLHNSKKSKDDEFLMACIAGIVGNNAVGYIHTQTKVKRAIDRKGSGFKKALMQNAQEVFLGEAEGQKFFALVGHADNKRLWDCFEHIAYGIYYTEYGISFKGECRLIMDFLFDENEQTEKIKLLCKKQFLLEAAGYPEKGANKSIFSYQFAKPDIYGIIPLKLTFYEGTNVYVSFMKEDISSPFQMIDKFVEIGIPTTVTLDSGEEFKFN